MRAVLDTNVLVSAALNEHAPPGQIVRASHGGAFDLVSSPELISELNVVLNRPRIRSRLGWSLEDVSDFMRGVVADAIHVIATRRLEVVRDPDDNRVLEAAVAGAADYIVSGDADLLALGVYEGIEIVTPARFAAILASADL